MQLSPHGLLFAGSQYLQHVPPDGGLVGTTTIGGFVGRITRVGAGAFVLAGALVATLFVAAADEPGAKNSICHVPDVAISIASIGLPRGIETIGLFGVT